MNLVNFKRLLKANSGRHTIYAQGPSGAGKSSIISEYYEENAEMTFYMDVRLGQRDSGEVKGILLPDLVNMCTMQSRPDYFPLPEEGSDVKGIMFLDEFDHATPAAASAAYELILDRKIGRYKLPDGIEIIMASNTRADGGLHFEVPKPIKNRVIMVKVKPDLEEWLSHARDSGINPLITGFVKDHGEYLFFGGNSNSEGVDDLGAFASPRSWFVANSCLDFEGVDDLLEETLNGTIGLKTTKAFLDYAIIANSDVNVYNVLDNTIKNLKGNEDLEDLSITNYILEGLHLSVINGTLDGTKFHLGIANWINTVVDSDTRTLIARSLMSFAPKVLKPTKANKEGMLVVAEILKTVTL